MVDSLLVTMYGCSLNDITLISLDVHWILTLFRYVLDMIGASTVSLAAVLVYLVVSMDSSVSGVCTLLGGFIVSPGIRAVGCRYSVVWSTAF